MKSMLFSVFLSLSFAGGAFTSVASACTNLLVTKGASEDGSVMITYTCDGEFHPHLSYMPAEDHEPGDSLAIESWGGEVRGWIEQVPHTCAVVDMMNEHQLAISETTFDGRKELRNPGGLLHYFDLIKLALQRVRTAREAISVMTDLVEEYGYLSTGESFSIADTEEAWILEMIGPGEGGVGAIWVAVRIPDGYISAHANKARIGEFPLDDPENCIYSENVISFAVERGYYDPDSGEPFLFNEAYCPSDPKNQRYGDARVWSIFNRAAPSLDLSPDYHRAKPGADPYPLWIKPDENLSVKDVFALMRDHYEGTPFDMSKGVDAGPYGLPYRFRPMHWTVDSVEYAWERPVSTQQTGFSFVSQSRSWLPDPIGGVYWYGMDDTWYTCYTPLYCGIDAIPESYTVGKLGEFSWESAWWMFNLVSNYSYIRYSDMIKDIQAVQSEIEEEHLALQPAIEKVAVELHGTDPDLMRRFLTDYSVSHGEQTVDRWRELAVHLITKYNDGYVKNERGRPEQVGYPEAWLRRVIEDRGDDYRIPQADSIKTEMRLVD